MALGRIVSRATSGRIRSLLGAAEPWPRIRRTACDRPLTIVLGRVTRRRCCRHCAFEESLRDALCGTVKSILLELADWVENELVGVIGMKAPTAKTAV